MKISIIIPAYNASACIGRALHSLAGQQLEDYEILVVDDASKDGTVQVVENLAQAYPIRFIQLPKNSGPSAARNAALDAAKGEWIAILDADDAYTDGRLTKLLDIAENQKADVIADNLMLFDEGVQENVGAAFNWPFTQSLMDATFLFEQDRPGWGYPLGWIKPLFKKSFLEEHAIRYPEAYRHGEDFYLLCNLLAKGAKFLLVDEPLYVYTLPRGKVSGQASQFTHTRFDMEKHEAMCAELVEKFGTDIPELEKLTRKRLDNVRAYQHFRFVRDAVRAKRRWLVAKHVVLHPIVLKYLYFSVLFRVKRKLVS